MSSPMRPTAPTPTSSPARKRIRPSARRSRRNAAPVPEAREAARHGVSRSDDRRWMAEAVALGEAARGRTAPNPNVGCVIVGGRRDRRARRHRARRPPPCRSGRAGRSRRRGARRDALHQPRALRPRQRRAARPAPTLIAAAGIARVVIALEDPDPRTAGQGIAMLRAAGIAVELGDGADAARAQPVGLSHPPRARPPADHAQAGAVDRRQDRAALGRIEMDHRRGRPRPRPSRARPQRHDPGRARHLSRRPARASTSACRGSRMSRRAAPC